MNADHFSIIGSTHHENQDYAISGNSVKYNYTGDCNVPFAIVSDGCSSAKDTDVGARLIAQNTKQYLYFGLKDTTMCRNVIQDSNQSIGQLGLNKESLLATCLSIRKIDIYFDVTICGDGVVIYKQKDKLTAISYSFVSGAPYYLQYSAFKEDDEQYKKQFTTNLIRKEYTWENNCLSIKEEELLIKKFYKEAFNINETQLIAISTDGINSFVEKIENKTSITNNKIELEEVIPELFNFKNYNGEFVKRRMIKAMETFKKKKWCNSDDFSVAVVYNGDFDNDNKTTI